MITDSFLQCFCGCLHFCHSIFLASTSRAVVISFLASFFSCERLNGHPHDRLDDFRASLFSVFCLFPSKNSRHFVWEQQAYDHGTRFMEIRAQIGQLLNVKPTTFT